jgi:predicted MFS family arabinose efflux permease
MNRTRIVVSLGVAQTLAWGATYYLPATLATPMARDTGVDPAMVFAAFSVALIVSAILQPAAGRAIDRLGGRPVLAAATLTCAAGLALLAVAEGPAILFLAWILIGVGMSGGLYDAAFATLAGIFGRQARAPITGITLIAGFASTVSWPLTTLVEAEFGWRVACLGWAAVLTAIAVPLNLSLPRRRTTVARDGAPAQRPAVRGNLVPMALLSFVFGVTWFSSTAMAAHLPRLLEVAGAAPAAAVAAAALVGPAQVAGRIVEFTLLRRASPFLSARAASLAHPLGAGVLLSTGAPAAPLFAGLHGAGNGVMTIASGTLPLAIFGPDGYGARQGLIAAPARFAAVLAPLAFAVLIDAFGAGALVVSSALGLASFAVLVLLGRMTPEASGADAR